jgi:mono/diheme cytochrome c family protein
MAATDQPYRNQKTLDMVFAVSCVAMLLSTLWMFVQDYSRTFKSVQRTFRDIEATIAERDLVDKLPAADQIAEKRVALRHARREFDKAKTSVERTDKRLQAKREAADVKYRTIKADYDSLMSYYNIAIDDAGKYPKDDPRHRSLSKEADGIKVKIEKLEKELGLAKDALDKIDVEIKTEVRAVLDGPERDLQTAEDEMKKLTGVSDRFAKLAAQKAWGSGDTFRALPILDGFESPTKIRQIWLPDLTIEYGSFKEVPRYDRCTTCHLGIDRGTYDKDTLRRLGDENENNRLTAKLVAAKEELEKREKAGENLGFSPGDLPGERQGSLWLITMLMLACSLVAALSLGILQQSMRLGVQTMTFGLAMTLLTAGALAVFSPRVTQVKTINLTPAQITQYAAHPRLDLFVDSNSPHSMEKFGCTVCHAGQGSATEFNLASHTPTDAKQEDRWKTDHHYHPSHFWDFPMLSRRFMESSCLKCHHQVTDLVRHGSKEEAPKLLRGYNLVQEMGCFGCHEIQGMKGGRPVGPDMRLEPGPALEFLSAADQEKAKVDPANPPGTMRKVGPSLRRLAEKTNVDWTLKWIHDPRGFRADTKMPHFYNLSTNTKDALPDDQRNFPAAEMHAIAHYLVHESKAHLEGKDVYRQALLAGKKNIKAMQAELVKAGLSDRDMKELFDVSRRFADLAILSAPTRNATINTHVQKQRQLQEQIAEMHRRGIESPDAKNDLKVAEQELRNAMASLEKAAMPVPLSAGLVSDKGEKITFPEKDGDPVEGRRLFTEKGCMACHGHEGTNQPYKNKEGKEVPAVLSEANFGPELSRIADKLAPAADKVTARMWLVQWLLNPNVYHPRTRMPITHLSAAQANDVATWLLSLKSGWQGTATDPREPTIRDYKDLARVYLGKAPSVTRAEVEQFLPVAGETLPGIPRERLETFGREAEERALAAGNLTPETLKWYVGKKAIGRLGCYGCHDIPGFETAKPIGTGLNDWGKKEGERLAFEDAEAFVKTHFNIVSSREMRYEVEARIKALEARPETERTQNENDTLANLKKQIELQNEIAELEKKELAKGLSEKEKDRLKKIRPMKFFEPQKEDKGKLKEPFEESFLRAIEHHQREGFLHLKLQEPRSLDYNRIRVWDDRLRMPQFKFARSRKKADESDDAYLARQEKEEAEAREAVMTFILGLVAEPIPLRYIHNPNPEKKAEIVGRQVLDKFNCAGCHQIRPGVFEFKATDAQALLDTSFASVARQKDQFINDHFYANHNAWTGPAPTSERLLAFGYRDPLATEAAKDKTETADATAIRLVEAFRFFSADRMNRDIPASNTLYLPNGNFSESTPYGGTWTDLMVAHLTRFDKDKWPDKDPAKARTMLPPPLLRQGERIQPDWLYRFLLNPSQIRPSVEQSPAYGVFLRMPKFNMSPEDSRAIVNYFASVAKMTNPGAGVTAPYTFIEQRDAEYWKRMAVQHDADVKKLLADARAMSTRDTNKEAWQKRVKEIETALVEKDRAKGAIKDLYSIQAYRLVTNRNLCLQCHSLGKEEIKGAQGPNLALSADRLRPEWVEQWVANPIRMFPYNPVMPQNFKNHHDPLQWGYMDTFVGTPLQQTRAVRDLIMDLPRLTDLLANNPPPPPAAAGGMK